MTRETTLAAVIAEHIAGVYCDGGHSVKEAMTWAMCDVGASHTHCGMCPEHGRPRYACRCKADNGIPES